MNIKTLALTLFVGTLCAACVDNARSAGPTAPSAKVFKGKTSGVKGIRAQIIVRKDSYKLDPTLQTRDVLKKLQAMQHPAVMDYEPGSVDMSAIWFKKLQKAMGITDKGQQTRSVEDIAKDPAAMKVMKAFQQWQAKRRADMDKASKAYEQVFGDARRKAPAQAQAFDALVRVHNDSKQDLVLWVGGDMMRSKLRLTGPGAISALVGQDFKEIFMMGRKVVIKPGKHADLPITSLNYGNRRHQLAAYATKAGKYQLELEWVFQVENGPNSRSLTMTFPAIDFDVTK